MAIEICDEKLLEIKNKIVKVRQITKTAAGNPDLLKKCQLQEKQLMSGSAPFLQEKKKLAEFKKNPFQPPPVIDYTDNFVEELKTNKDIAKDEIKFTFTPSKTLMGLKNNIYAKYYFTTQTDP